LAPRCTIATITSVPGHCINRRITMQKFPFRSILYPKTAKKKPNAWNIQTFDNIFVIVCPILMKFRTATHIRLLKPMSNQKFENFKIQVHRRQSTRKFTKISITFYSSFQNSEKSAYNRLPAKPIKYSNFYDIFADVWPISMKFCMTTHIKYPDHNSCSKSQISKKFKRADAAV